MARRSHLARGTVPLEDVFLHRELVTSAILRTFGGRTSGVAYGPSISRQELHFLREELSLARRSLVASEAERALLLRSLLRERRDVDDHRQASTSANPDPRRPPSKRCPDMNELHEENLLLRARVKKWKKAAAGKSREIKSMQREFCSLKDPTHTDFRDDQALGNDLSDKVRQLEVQVSLLKDVITEATTTRNETVDRASNTDRQRKYRPSHNENRPKFAPSPRPSGNQYRYQDFVTRGPKRGVSDEIEFSKRSALADAMSTHQNIMAEIAEDTNHLQKEVISLLDRWNTRGGSHHHPR